MTDKPVPPAPPKRGLAAKIQWPPSDDAPDLPGVLAVRGPDDPGARDTLEPCHGVGTDELIARVSQPPTEPAGTRDPSGDGSSG